MRGLGRFRRELGPIAALHDYTPIVLNAHRFLDPKPSPLVTIILPTYNWSSVLRYSIASVLWQNYNDFELIVVGDGCTDDSAEVVSSFRDSRVRWVGLNENSGGQVAPNNHALGLAKGSLIAYLGHDDLWLPNHLGHLVAAIDRQSAAIVSSACLALGPAGSDLVRLTGGSRGGRAGDWCPPSSILHRRSAVETTGLWRNHREIEEPPDLHFVRQFSRMGLKHSHVPNLSVLKFNASWRPDSYVKRASDEQRLYFSQIESDKFFVERQLLSIIRLRRRNPPEVYETAREPGQEDDPKGWLVNEWRRIRGLPPLDG